MTVYHHNVMQGENGGERIPEETIWLLIMSFMQHAQGLASFPGSYMYMQGEPGIYSHVTMMYVIKIGPEFLEQKNSIFHIVPPTMHLTLSVYDTRPLITREV